jgi:AhpD family alkylhydroperoxidase
MHFSKRSAGLGLAALLFCSQLAAEEPAPPGPALTRPEMKQRLEDLKQRTARIPLPSLTEEEIAAGRRSVNNGRLRSLYLPSSWSGGIGRAPAGGNRPPGTAGAERPRGGGIPGSDSPDYAFKTRLFWIVSRTNDCQYCLGHQELKLRRAGMSEDEIAALDSAWELFPAAEQAAMALTRKLTMQPHLITPADLDQLRPFYTERELVDIILTIARYNSTNRWTSSTGIPQDQAFGSDEPSQLNTPTSAAYESVRSKVAPADYQPRPEWESAEAVAKAFQQARQRQPLVELPELSAIQPPLELESSAKLPVNWLRAMSIAGSAASALRQREAHTQDGQTSLPLRHLIAWVSARENRAWYAAHHAQLDYLGSNPSGAAPPATFQELVVRLPAADAAALQFARKLTAAPHTIVDADVAELRQHFNDHQVAEIIYLTCEANSFDRFTEALQLPIE